MKRRQTTGESFIRRIEELRFYRWRQARRGYAGRIERSDSDNRILQRRLHGGHEAVP